MTVLRAMDASKSVPPIRTPWFARMRLSLEKSVPRIGLSSTTENIAACSEPRGRRRGPRVRRLLQHPRLALVARSRGAARKLALHNLRDHADQPPSDEHAGRGRRGRNAPHDPVVGRSSCWAKCSWPRGDSDLPVGSAMRTALTVPRRDQRIGRGSQEGPRFEFLLPPAESQAKSVARAALSRSGIFSFTR